VLINQK